MVGYRLLSGQAPSSVVSSNRDWRKMKALIAAVTATLLLTISGVAQAADPVALVKKFKGDCLACHAVDKKVVGPAWKDVAAKYRGVEGAQAVLIQKVITGGKGNYWWAVTGGTAMTPHHSKPTSAEIEQIVAAILAL